MTQENIELSRLVDARVHDATGKEAIVTSVQPTEDDAQVRLQFADGLQVLVPLSLLIPDAEHGFRVPFRLEPGAAGAPVQMSFPVMEEVLHVDRHRVDTGRGVRIHKHVAEREHIIEESLRRDELVVEHVNIGSVLTDGQLPQTRYEGDTLIVPVLEEVLVVQKQLLLKEEVRITRRERRVHAPQRVILKAEQITVERFDEQARPTQ
jgi:uncharacterized protein (TIGR02271 family)